jgi:hypothetical protein
MSVIAAGAMIVSSGVASNDPARDMREARVVGKRERGDEAHRNLRIRIRADSGTRDSHAYSGFCSP